MWEFIFYLLSHDGNQLARGGSTHCRFMDVRCSMVWTYLGQSLDAYPSWRQDIQRSRKQRNDEGYVETPRDRICRNSTHDRRTRLYRGCDTRVQRGEKCRDDMARVRHASRCECRPLGQWCKKIYGHEDRSHRIQSPHRTPRSGICTRNVEIDWSWK